MINSYPELLLAENNLKKPSTLKLLNKGGGKLVRTKSKT